MSGKVNLDTCSYLPSSRNCSQSSFFEGRDVGIHVTESLVSIPLHLSSRYIILVSGVTAVLGNRSISASDISPAHIPSAIYVGASTINEAKWEISNYGSAIVTVFTPELNIIRA